MSYTITVLILIHESQYSTLLDLKTIARNESSLSGVEFGYLVQQQGVGVTTPDRHAHCIPDDQEISHFSG
jgi:hypothetical protein